MLQYEKIFKEIAENNPNIEFDRDKLSNQKYLIFNSYEDALKCKGALSTFINEQTESAGLSNVTYLDFSSNTYTPAIVDANAPKLNIVTIRLDNDHLIIINNADLKTVRKELLGDKTDYTHSVTFKCAEFHGYPHFKNLETGVDSLPGTSVKNFAKWFGQNIVRDERAFDEKYFDKRGNTLIKGGFNPKEDKASIGVEVLITQAQLEIARKVFAEYSEVFAKSAPAAQYLNEPNTGSVDTLLKVVHYIKEAYYKDTVFYNFFTNNCHNDVTKLFNALGYSGHYLNFVRADNLDFNDMGLLYEIKEAHGSCFVLKTTPWGEASKSHESWFPWPLNTALKHAKYNFDLDYLDSVSASNQSQILERAKGQDKDGNNALHQALLVNDIDKANLLIELGVDVNVPNKRGEIALHLAAKLTPSEMKLKLLEKLIDSTTQINAHDLFSDYIPLSFAVQSDDPEAIKLLVKHGADLHFINSTYEKLSNIAVAWSAKNAAKALQELDPEIMHFDNLTRQIPIHHPNIKDALEISEEIPVKAKTVEEEYIMISDIHQYFDILVSSGIQPEVV